MSVFYQVLDHSSGNVIADFETEVEALAALCRVGQDHGLEELEHLALLRFQDGHPHLVVMEDDLVSRIQAEICGPVLMRTAV